MIEGVDGAGKRTLTDGLRAAFEADGSTVATLAFPRYGASVHADLAAEALHGGHGDLSDSVYAMAVLFALDRAGARDEIGRLHGRLRRRDPRPLRRVQRRLQRGAAAPGRRRRRGRLGARPRVRPVRPAAPDWQVLLDVPAELAAERAEHRANDRSRPGEGRLRARRRLQRRTGEVYSRAGRSAMVRAVAGRGPDVDDADRPLSRRSVRRCWPAVADSRAW